MDMCLTIWRYSINEGEYGGIVFADTIISATEKVKRKYSDKTDKEICVWRMIEDVYFDMENLDVWECYGL